ncbi:MoaD/ThiS family protein [Sphingomonas sp.]|uniref:MoaD/ThiS family protein n=1 Tax=Sphingomonas sp. TaxID=28214 RepID=UPI00286BCD2F|nr:MoaD/ThiS family protein [Sphingomonas sp.]
MKLTFFGRLREAVGAGEFDCLLPANVVDSQSLRTWIGADHPNLLDPKVRIAFDDVLVGDAAPIAGVVEVAFLPPVSGG